jgi:hypothetical protein
MNGTIITCPACGTQIELTEVLSGQVRGEMEPEISQQTEVRQE